MLCVAAQAVAQKANPERMLRPWLGASVGVANLRVDGDGHPGYMGELFLGIEHRSGIRLGARLIEYSGISLGDQSPWSSSTQLLVAGYGMRGWPALFTLGIGRLTPSQDGPDLGAMPVLETGIELFVPPRHGVSLRGYGAFLWRIGDLDPLPATSFRPKVGPQLVTGIGAVIH